MKPFYTVSIESQNFPVRGNCMVSGDNTFDKKCEDVIIERLERGDLSARCCVKVTATVGDFEGVAYLGDCSLNDQYMAQQCAEEHGMQEEALEDLKRELRAAVMSGHDAERILSELE